MMMMNKNFQKYIQSYWLHTGPSPFLVQIDDISQDIISDIHLFADDIILIQYVDDPVISANILNSDLSLLMSWTSWPLTPRATSNNMRIQHISISKLDSYSSSIIFTCFIWWFHLKQIVVPTICGTMYCIMGHREWVPKFRVPKFRSSHASSEAPETSSFQVPKFPELQVPKFPEL